MAVTVTPETFTMVEFDPAVIAGVVERLTALVELPDGTDVRIEVDERVPLARAILVSTDPVLIQIEGGALEDPKRPRHLSEDVTADVLGRLLFQARDRLDPDFGAVPAFADLSLALVTAWQVACAGRLVARGLHSQRQRWLYAFRNRHGFTDAADAAFDRLWSPSAPLTWSEIEALSLGAVDVVEA